MNILIIIACNPNIIIEFCPIHVIIPLILTTIETLHYCNNIQKQITINEPLIDSIIYTIELPKTNP